jgi:hypothetical protein
VSRVNYSFGSGAIRHTAVRNGNHPGPGSDVVIERRDFGVRDSKGRAIGGLVQRYTVETRLRTDADGDYGIVYMLDAQPGTFYCYKPHATRDGKSFGAIQPSVWFATAAERDAAVEKYFAGAAKRAPKVRT